MERAVALIKRAMLDYRMSHLDTEQANVHVSQGFLIPTCDAVRALLDDLNEDMMGEIWTAKIITKDKGTYDPIFDTVIPPLGPLSMDILFVPMQMSEVVLRELHRINPKWQDIHALGVHHDKYARIVRLRPPHSPNPKAYVSWYEQHQEQADVCVMNGLYMMYLVRNDPAPDYLPVSVVLSTEIVRELEDGMFKWPKKYKTMYGYSKEAFQMILESVVCRLNCKQTMYRYELQTDGWITRG